MKRGVFIGAVVAASALALGRVEAMGASPDPGQPSAELFQVPGPRVPDDCVPCPGDPWLLCCQSLSLVTLGPDAIALLEQCANVVNSQVLFREHLLDLRRRVAVLEECHRNPKPGGCEAAVGK